MKQFCLDRKLRFHGARALALCMACTLLTALTVPAAAAEPIGDGVTATYDEAYYATLDYYGNLTNGSVVKSYTLNGAASLTDYGAYDEVRNLTDNTAAKSADGATTFDFGSAAPDRFYFEGVTSQPYDTLPWVISLHYALNGVPTPADELAGKVGSVEIFLDLVPNAAAAAYAKNNYALMAMSMFNADDIVSLEADGAQVQLVGNLRAVVFMALPGEEQHFSIRVGSNNFSFGGMTFLMVPATLSQLDQIADLSQQKDDLEENYHKLSGSLDTLLDSLDGMSGSLYATANGLEELNDARGTISAGKGDLYTKADTLLGDLDALNASLSTVPGHLDTATQAADDVNKTMQNVADTAEDVQDSMADVQDAMANLRADLDDIRKMTGTSSKKTGALQEGLTKLGQDAAALKASLDEMLPNLSALNLEIGGEEITAQGKTLSELSDSLTSAKGLDSAYQTLAGEDGMTFDQFAAAALMIQASQKGQVLSASAARDQVAAMNELINGVEEQIRSVAGTMIAGGMDSATAAEQAKDAVLAGLDAAMGEGTLEAYQSAKVLQAAYTAAVGENAVLNESGFFAAMMMVEAIGKNPAGMETILSHADQYLAEGANGLTLYNLHKTGLLSQMSNLCDDLGSVDENGNLNGGITKDLVKLSGLAGNTLGSLDDVADAADDLVDEMDDVVAQLQDMAELVNDYTPDLKQALADAKTAVNALTGTISDTHSFLSSFEALLKTAGSQLDTGTKDTLANLAVTLRKAANSLNTTGDVKSAKTSISDIIEDVWNDHTGDVDGLLNMDSTAETISMTDGRNPSPLSVQVLIRTQEIQVDDEAAAAQTAQPAAPTTFWGRVSALFANMWDSFLGIFRH